MAANDAEHPHEAAARQATVDLVGFFAHEMEAFGHHLGSAVHQFSGTGTLPDSAFADVPPAKRGRAVKGERAKRKPSAFNQFIKEKLEEMQRNGDAGPVAAGEGQRKSNSNFKSAVAAWKLLSDEQRKAYTSNFKEHQQEAEHPAGGGAEAEPDAFAEADAGGAAEPEDEFVEAEEDEDVDDDEDEAEEEEDEELPAPAPPVPAPAPPPARVTEPTAMGAKKRKPKLAEAPAEKKKNKKAPAPLAPTPAPAAAPAAGGGATSEKKKKKKKLQALQ